MTDNLKIWGKEVLTEEECRLYLSYLHRRWHTNKEETWIDFVRVGIVTELFMEAYDSGYIDNSVSIISPSEARFVSGLTMYIYLHPNNTKLGLVLR